MRTALITIMAITASASVAQADLKQDTAGKYAEVNGLKIYYEVHGTGKPLVLIHGAFGTADGWGTVMPALTKSHQVIAVELQAHGHTADRSKPLEFVQMADDVAELLKSLNLKGVDIFGYSMGGTVALGLAIRHPDLVEKLAILGSVSGSTKDTYEPENYRQLQSLPDNFAPPVLKGPYDKVAPDPKNWPVLVSKIRGLVRDFTGFSAEQVKSIKAKTLIMIGDHEGIRPEHAVEMYRLIPKSQLAIFPGGDHFMLYTSAERVLSTLTPFLDRG